MPDVASDRSLKALVVDDEPLARARGARLLDELGVQVVAEAPDAATALEKARVLDIDFVLLDVSMPQMDGLTLVRQGLSLPVIFATAHAEYAVEAFDLDVCDYLVKPIKLERLAKAVDRVRGLLSDRESEKGAQNPRAPHLVVRSLGEAKIVPLDCIQSFSASEKYTLFTVEQEEHLIRDSIKALAERYHPFGFMQVHRGHLVRIDAIRSFRRMGEGGEVVLNNNEIVEVSRRFVPHVLAVIDRIEKAYLGGPPRASSGSAEFQGHNQ